MRHVGCTAQQAEMAFLHTHLPQLTKEVGQCMEYLTQRQSKLHVPSYACTTNLAETSFAYDFPDGVAWQRSRMLLTDFTS